MRIVVPNVLFMCVVLGLCLGSGALGQPTVTFGIQSAGPNNLGGVYTDPYNGRVCAANQTDCSNGPYTSVLAFCDDFQDDVTPPQYWQAFVTDLSQVTTGTQTIYYSTSINGYSNTTLYIAAAMLAVNSLTARAANNVAAENQLSYAIWSLFDPNMITSSNASQTCTQYGCMATSDWNTALADRNAALTAAAAYQSGAAYESTGVNVTIYSQTNAAKTGVNTSSTRRQEFIVVQTPEPSTWVELSFNCAGIALIGFVCWRRGSRISTKYV